MSEENLPKVEPGHVWRLASGDEVVVERVEGDHVSGASRLAARTSSGEQRGTVGIAAFEGHRRDFAGAVLIAPVYRVTFRAPVQGQHPNEDPVFQALTGAEEVQVEARRTPHIASGTPQEGGIRADLAEYVAEVAAEDAEAAKAVVAAAVAPHGAVEEFQADEVR